VGPPFGYHLRLAVRSLRRDPALSAAILVALSVAASTWSFMSAIYVRGHAPHPEYSAGLHQVELPHPRAYPLAAASTGMAVALAAPLGRRTRVTWREAQVLSGSGIPARQTATCRARLLVGRPGQPPRRAPVRFVDADFFSMFGRRFAEGGPWTAADQRAGAPVAVLGPAAAPWLGGGEVLVDGQRHRVAGVLADHQPFWAEWDLSAVGMDQDAVYLPFPELRTLAAAPEMPIFQDPLGAGAGEADPLYVSHWADLPDREARQAYRHFVEERFPGAVLRSLAQWRAEFPLPASSEVFFSALTLLLLLGGGFNMARLLLAKGLARGEEIGIHRALGARRAGIFGQQMLEAGLLSLTAALLAQLVVLPYVQVWNRVVRDTDIPLPLTASGFVMGMALPLAIGLLSGLYPAWRLSSIRPAVSVARR
jgi:putative ABC transport system permease protein